MLGQDLRYALRSLGKSKSFVAVAVVSLALALGLDTTMYAVLDAFMHPYVAFREPERLVEIWLQGDPRAQLIPRSERSRLIRDQLQSLPSVEQTATMAFNPRTFIQFGSSGDNVVVADVSLSFFSVLDVAPETGRNFNPGGDESVAVISHRLWANYLGRRKALAGATFVIGNRSFDVIGVMPATMSYPNGADVWIPSPPSAGDAYRVVRLKSGVTLKQFEAQLAAVAHAFTQRFGTSIIPWRFSTFSLRPDPFELSRFHLAMAASALAVLLIACANLANLMHARGVARRGELALRLAIGASRKAIVRPLLAEAVVLAAAGGLLGVFAAAWGVSIVGTELPRLPFLSLQVPHLSWRLFAFGFLAAAVTVVLFGLLPALRASDVDVAEPLKEGAATTTGRIRRYSLLAITQVALALMLLMSAAVLVKSAYRLTSLIFGYEPRGVVRAHTSLRPERFADGMAVERGFDDVTETVRRMPGVSSAATFAEVSTPGAIAMSDNLIDTLSRISLPRFNQVSPEFLRTLGLPVVRGRDFEPGDRAAGGAVIVNQVAASVLWPFDNPIGHLVKLGPPRSAGPWLRVVGIAQNARFGLSNASDPDLPTQPQAYVVPPLDSIRTRNVVVRLDPTAPLLPNKVAREIQAAASLPNAPYVFPWLYDLEPMTRAQHFATSIFLFLGCCGLGLAAVGLYGVLAYTVSRRMREFGVRVALGAQNEDLFRLVLHDGTVITLAGTAVGAFIAMTAASLLGPLLFYVQPTDAVSLVVAELLLCLTAFLACLAPALRAMRADPMEILRAT